MMSKASGAAGKTQKSRWLTAALLPGAGLSLVVLAVLVTLSLMPSSRLLVRWRPSSLMVTQVQPQGRMTVHSWSLYRGQVHHGTMRVILPSNTTVSYTPGDVLLKAKGIVLLK